MSPTSTQFVVGGTGPTNQGDIGTALSLAATINGLLSSAAQTVNATADGTILNLNINGCTINWSSTFQPAQLYLVQQPQWGDILDGVSGWEEYVAIDMAIKALQKEESDVSVVGAQKAAMLKRIEAMAENRDSGQPFTITDVKGGGWNGGQGGFGGYY